MANLRSVNIRPLRSIWQVSRDQACTKTGSNTFPPWRRLSTTAVQRLPAGGFSVSFSSEIVLPESPNIPPRKPKADPKKESTRANVTLRKSSPLDPSKVRRNSRPSQAVEKGSEASASLRTSVEAGSTDAPEDTFDHPNLTQRQEAKKASKEFPKKSNNMSSWPIKKKEAWQIQKAALEAKFGDEGWRPRKKMSPDTIEGIRALHEQYPDKYSTPVLAAEFKVSAEAIRRILKSSFRPTPEIMEARRQRWAKRHDRIWDQQAEIGLRPQRTKEMKVENPEAFEEGLKARQVLASQR